MKAAASGKDINYEGAYLQPLNFATGTATSGEPVYGLAVDGGGESAR